MKLSPEQLKIRALRRKIKRILPAAIDALDREADSLHVREASADEGLQRAIRVLRDLHRTMDYRA
jgi:hypothetical protein